MEAILGIEFIEGKARVFELINADRALEVGVIDQIILPVGSIKEGIVVEPKLVAGKISAFLKEKNIFTGKVVALIDPALAFTRIVRLPSNLSEEQININLEAELNQYRQFLGKEATISFNKLEEISEEGIKKINILFTAVYKAASKSYLNTFEAAGLDLVDIDVPILSLLRALDQTDIAADSLDVTLLMLIQDKQLEMCILKGNRPRFLHSVEIDTAGFDKDPQLFVERLLSMVKLVVNFYQARFVQGEEISRIVLNPLSAKFNQLHILLQEKLPHIPIQLSRPLNKVHVDQGKGIDIEDLRFGFSCLVGAALRLQGKEGVYSLNILFKEKAQRKNRLTQIYLISAALSVILAVTIIMLGVIFLRTYILQVRIARYAAKLKQRPQDFSRAIFAKERIDALEKQIGEAQAVSGAFKKPRVFYNIARAIVLVPADLWLTEVLMDKKSSVLTLNGQAIAEKPIFDYVSALSNSGHFMSVDLVSSRGHAKGVEFSIKCQIK